MVVAHVMFQIRMCIQKEIKISFYVYVLLKKYIRIDDSIKKIYFRKQKTKERTHTHLKY